MIFEGKANLRGERRAIMLAARSLLPASGRHSTVVGYGWSRDGDPSYNRNLVE